MLHRLNRRLGNGMPRVAQPLSFRSLLIPTLTLQQSGDDEHVAGWNSAPPILTPATDRG